MALVWDDVGLTFRVGLKVPYPVHYADFFEEYNDYKHNCYNYVSNGVIIIIIIIIIIVHGYG